MERIMSAEDNTPVIMTTAGGEAEPAPTGTSEIVFSKTLSLSIQAESPTSVASCSQTSSPVEETIDSRTTASTMTTATSSASGSSLLLLAKAAVAAGPLNVKFAPLPELAPRKRRSTVPLGMAARSQLMRRRRYQDPDAGPRYCVGGSPMWTEEELAEAKIQQVAAAMAKERGRREAGADPDDPLVLLGRKMKEASRHIWKKVSKKDVKKEREKENVSEQGETERNCSVDERAPDLDFSPEDGCGLHRQQRTEKQDNHSDSSTESSSAPTSKPATSMLEHTHTPLRSILMASLPAPGSQEQVEGEQGSIWEEEIDPHCPLDASQSESSFDMVSTPPPTNRLSIWSDDSQLSGFPATQCATPVGADTSTIHIQSS